jgi:hypothetical protein
LLLQFLVKMKKYKPTKEESKALKRLEDMTKVWEKMHPFEMAMAKKTVELALPKSTRKILKNKANSKENIKAVKKFFDQVDSLKI